MSELWKEPEPEPGTEDLMKLEMFEACPLTSINSLVTVVYR